MSRHPHTGRALALQDQGLQSLRAPKPEEAVSTRGRVPVAVRRAHVERDIVPPAAAPDGLIPGRRPLWITCRAVPIVACVIPIGYPSVELVPPWIGLSIRAARSFFPFRLSGQAFPSPGAIRFRVLLAYLHDWMLLQTRDVTTWTPRCTPVGAIDLLALFSREDNSPAL